MSRSLLVAAALLCASPACAQDSGRLMSARPQGFAGTGHDENHAHYQDLHNHMGGSCCNGHDCRPTQARWNAGTGNWEAMVEGQWQAIANADLVLDDAFLQSQHHPRWDSQAHICASDYAAGDGTYRVFCLIPPGSGQ